MENAIHRVVARGDRRTNGARLQDTGSARERAVTVCVCARGKGDIYDLRAREFDSKHG